MFSEKFCFHVLYHFLNQTIGNMAHTSYVAHNVCIWMKFASLYKGVILTVQGKCSIGQGKCSNYTNVLPIQEVYKAILCEKFQSILDNFFFFFVLSSKDCTLARYTFLYHTLILCTLFNSHMTIRILISLMMLEKKFCFYVLYHFLNQTIRNIIHTSYVWMKFVLLYKGVILTVQGKCLIGQGKCSLQIDEW